jgi:hypothetical protein
MAKFEPLDEDEPMHLVCAASLRSEVFHLERMLA